MRLFVRVAKRRSFSLAARDLGLPASIATDAVKQLEARLGVRLLERTTRHVAMTPDGEAYYRRCLAILDDVEDAESVFGSAKPKSVLRIDAQGRLARRFPHPKAQVCGGPGVLAARRQARDRHRRTVSRTIFPRLPSPGSTSNLAPSGLGRT